MDMQHVYWIGGSPCAGKTTIAHIIAQEYGWQTIHLDRHMEEYLQRAKEEQHPTLARYRKDGLQMFLSQTAEEQFSAVQQLSHEQFEFILDTIRQFDSDSPILVEGANILASDVIRVVSELNHVVWLVPTEEFQLQTYPRRGTWVLDVLRQNFPEEQRVDVFEQWMLRDTLMAEWTANQARMHNIPVRIVDGTLTIRENAQFVGQHFGLPGMPKDTLR